MSAYLLPKGMKCSGGVQQGTARDILEEGPVSCTVKPGWVHGDPFPSSKGKSLEIIFHGTVPRHSFSFLVSLPNGCVHVKRGHQKGVTVERRARPTPSPLFLGPAVRGQLSRQLSRHCSLPGKNTARDVLGHTWERVRVPVKMGIPVCLGEEASRGSEIQYWLCATRDCQVVQRLVSLAMGAPWAASVPSPRC